MNQLNLEVCSLLRAEIKNSGKSYKQLARQINTSEITLTQYLHHHSPFPVETAFKLTRALGMPLSQLVAEAEQRVEAI